MDYIQLWKDSMTGRNGDIPKRLKDDETEEAFWASMVEKKQRFEEDPYARIVQQELFSLLKNDDHVLEIGPGWGNYTFAIANEVQRLTCIDSSRSIIEFLDSRISSRHAENIELIHGKFESEKTEHKYDVVFGFNCYYRMYDIGQALLKMNESANRLVIAGMTTGPEKPHYMELYRMGYSINLKQRDYIHILNVLYQLGILAECKIVPLQSRKTYSSYEQLISDNITKILDYDYDLQEVEKVISKYVSKQDGVYEYIYPFHAALVYWTPV